MNGRSGTGLLGGSQMALLLATFGLSLCGIALVFSASTGSPFSNVTNHYLRQIFWLGLGILGFFAAASIPFTLYEGLRAYALWGIANVLLVLVLLIGSASLGAQRWLDLNGVRFQPSELAKLATVMALAHYMAGRRRDLRQVRNLLVPAGLVLVPTLLILREPDLGTSLSFPFMLLAMLYWAGLPLSYLALLVSPVVSLIAAFSATSWGIFALGFVLTLYYSVVRHRLRWAPVILLAAVNLGVGIATPQLWASLKDYQRQRVTTFLNPSGDRHGSGYQIIQSEIAIGSGGILGQGFRQGTQKNFQFLPEKHTDFVFSVAGEEFGLAGCLFLIGLYGVLFNAVIEIARRARSRFASLLAFGIGSVLFFHVVVNVAMTIGFAPVAGLPLPLLSYGGTALLVNLAGLGLVVGIGRRRHQY